MGVGLAHDQIVVDAVALAALVAGDDARRHAGGTHGEDEGARRSARRKPRRVIEQELVDAVFTEQRRRQCVEELLHGGSGRACAESPLRPRESPRAPLLGQFARVRGLLPGRRDVCAVR
jgi:hypothetical protein